MSEYLAWGLSGTVLKEQGSYNLVENNRAQRACVKASGSEGLEPEYYSILFY